MASTSQLIPVKNHTDEFGTVEYLLQLQLKAPNLKVSECYDISVRQLKELFASKIDEFPTPDLVDVFVPLNTLQQPLSDIIAHGIRVNQKTGFRFMADGIPLQPDQKVYELIHLVVALGNIYNYQKADIGIQDIEYSEIATSPSCLPEGFNSLRVSDKNEFVVFNQNQISSLHLVKIDGGDNLSHEAACTHVCKICGNHNATVYCKNDGCKLCDECDEKTHSGNPLLEDHERIPIADALISIQDCPFHPGNKVKYYCPKCHIPVCMECKIKDTHSKGEFSKHRLIEINAAYNEAMNSLKKPNTTYITREKILTEQLKATNKKIAQIEDNQKQLIAEINRIAQKAIAEAMSQTGEIAKQAKSRKVELERKLEELRNQKNLMDTHKKSEPVPFLAAYYRNYCLERETADNKDLPPPPSDLKADLMVYGKLEISHPKNERSAIIARGLGEDDTVDSEYSTDEDTTHVSSIYDSPSPHITSLERMAKRKSDKYAQMGVNLSFTPFEGSQIISEEAAATLYLCFPFKGQPETHLIFSTERDGRSIAKMHKLIDGMGITAVLVKANGQVFGGFAASKWNKDGVPFGKNSSSFLFSITKDGFIPYRPQSDEPVCLFATRDTLTFGKYDLCLAGNFDECSSTIENSFGVGFPFDSQRARTYLAEASEFKADVVEVWGFFSGKN